MRKTKGNKHIDPVQIYIIPSWVYLNELLQITVSSNKPLRSTLSRFFSVNIFFAGSLKQLDLADRKKLWTSSIDHMNETRDSDCFNISETHESVTASTQPLLIWNNRRLHPERDSGAENSIGWMGTSLLTPGWRGGEWRKRDSSFARDTMGCLGAKSQLLFILSDKMLSSVNCVGYLLDATER